MSDFFGTLINFGVNVLLASLIPSAFAGLFLKALKKRRSYSTGIAGKVQFTRDSRILAVVFNGAFLAWLWAGQNWFTMPISEQIQSGLVIFYIAFFCLRPSAVTAIPDLLFDALTLVGQIVGSLMEGFGPYDSWKRKVTLARLTKEDHITGFSGPEISSLKYRQQLLVSQIKFTCYSCGLEKDKSNIGEILEDGNGHLLYYCDDAGCRKTARDLYSKLFLSRHSGAKSP